MKRTVKLFKPFPLQRQILDHPARFKVLACGRRFSKSSIGKIAIAEVALKQREEVFWVAPTFKTSSKVWRDLKETFKNVIIWKNEAERTVGLVGGGIFSVWSAQNYDSIRGSNPKAVILDEAAMMNSDVWDAVVRPSLSDKKGVAYFLSTPRGRNFFYDLFVMGKSTERRHKNYMSWRYPSWYNEYVPKSEFIEAKLTLHKKIFGQEYMAEFLLDASEVFSGVSQVCTLEQSEPYDGTFVFGVDVGRKNDPTVITVWDKYRKNLIDFSTLYDTEFSLQEDFIKKEYRKWNDVGHVQKINIESNYAPMFVERLMQTDMPVRAFRTGNDSKSEIVNRLATAIQNKEVKMQNDKDLLFEFQAFTLSMTETGKPKYAAPVGYHDDIVMSACIGFDACYSSGIQVASMDMSIFQR